MVYSKPPFAGPEVVLKYLVRYTHRVALSNRRLLSLTDGVVQLQYKDYAARGVEKTLTLSAAEFLRRFLQHVLPRGFVKVRHYGLWANRYREANLEVCRRLLVVLAVAALIGALPLRAEQCCPVCGGQRWAVVARTRRPRVAEVCAALPLGADTSWRGSLGCVLCSEPALIRQRRFAVRAWAGAGRGRGRLVPVASATRRAQSHGPVRVEGAVADFSLAEGDRVC